MAIELFHDQTPRKYGTRPGSNSQPLDLQANLFAARSTCKLVPVAEEAGLRPTRLQTPKMDFLI